jgi:hypothetical protein
VRSSCAVLDPPDRGSLNDADLVRIVVLERKQSLLGSDYAVCVIFSVVAEQAHGDPVRHGANRSVVAGEILGAANLAGLACAAHQLLDLAALAGWLASRSGVNGMRSPYLPKTLRYNGAARGTSLSPCRSICKLLNTHAAHLPRIPVPRCRVNKG